MHDLKKMFKEIKIELKFHEFICGDMIISKTHYFK